MDETLETCRRLYNILLSDSGGRVILVNPSGTSQKCSRCGEMVSKSLSERVHQCLKCGLTLDRDINVAKNILKVGLERSHAETEPLLVRRTSKFQSRKREANEFYSFGSSLSDINIQPEQVVGIGEDIESIARTAASLHPVSRAGHQSLDGRKYDHPCASKARSWNQRHRAVDNKHGLAHWSRVSCNHP